jgi:hypothetical protein
VKPNRAALLGAMLCAAAAAAYAQEMPGAEGPKDGPALGDGPHEIAAVTAAAKRARVASRRVTLPMLDAAPLLAEDTRRAAIPALKSDPRVGVIRRFHEIRAPRRLVAGGAGVESQTDGSLVWSAEVDAPGALGLRLHASRCELPRGAEVVVYDADEPSEAYGPFTRGGDGERGAFLLPTVFGERVVVEVRVPPSAAGAKLSFSIDRVAQRYRDRGEVALETSSGMAGKTGSCNNDVACDSSYVQDVARAVATMEITASDGVYLCSGALMNDSVDATFVPYFLTAHHCLSLESEANDTEFFFDYRAATCGGLPPPLSSVPRVSGSTLLASSASSDFTLLRLTGTMPSNRFFCGWNANRQDEVIDVVGVHHPGGTEMRISYGTLLGPDGSFLDVQWFSGVTAGGSSGSPLFNEAKQVIGQLYGGSSSCSFPSGVDLYGRFDRTYPSVAQYLGQGAGDPGRDVYDPADDTAGGARVLAISVTGGVSGPQTLSDSDAADWFAFDLVAGQRYRFFSLGVDDVVATLYSNAAGTTVAADDDDSAGSLQFSIDFTPPSSGRYRLAVRTVVADAPAEYTLVYEQVDASVTATPLPVGRLRKSVSTGVVVLKWRDRSAVETGYYVDLSDDAGVTWSRVAELPRNSRRFEHDPGAGLHLYRVGAWNAGASIRYKTITVNVRDLNALDAFDPADDRGAGATTISPPGGGVTSVHTLSRQDAEDWFAITLTSGVSYTFESEGSGDVYGELFDDEDGTLRLAGNDDSGAGRNFRIVHVAQRTGTHWIRVTPYSEGAAVSYSLRWTQN